MNLVLFLSEEYFDEIREGKNVEYREVKPHYIKMFIINEFKDLCLNSTPENVKVAADLAIALNTPFFKKFDCIDLRRSYSKTSLVKRCEGITIEKGPNHPFCKPDKYYFVISLGDIVSERCDNKI
jgi:hypothetical protein